MSNQSSFLSNAARHSHSLTLANWCSKNIFIIWWIFWFDDFKLVLVFFFSVLIFPISLLLAFASRSRAGVAEIPSSADESSDSMISILFLMVFFVTLLICDFWLRDCDGKISSSVDSSIASLCGCPTIFMIQGLFEIRKKINFQFNFGNNGILWKQCLDSEAIFQTFFQYKFLACFYSPFFTAFSTEIDVVPAFDAWIQIIIIIGVEIGVATEPIDPSFGCFSKTEKQKTNKTNMMTAKTMRNIFVHLDGETTIWISSSSMEFIDNFSNALWMRKRKRNKTCVNFVCDVFIAIISIIFNYFIHSLFNSFTVRPPWYLVNTLITKRFFSLKLISLDIFFMKIQENELFSVECDKDLKASTTEQLYLYRLLYNYSSAFIFSQKYCGRNNTWSFNSMRMLWFEPSLFFRTYSSHF